MGKMIYGAYLPFEFFDLVLEAANLKKEKQLIEQLSDLFEGFDAVDDLNETLFIKPSKDSNLWRVVMATNESVILLEFRLNLDKSYFSFGRSVDFVAKILESENVYQLLKFKRDLIKSVNAINLATEAHIRFDVILRTKKHISFFTDELFLAGNGVWSLEDINDKSQ